jgi:UDP-N-acetylmuramyl pentapeptide synthase
LSAAVVDFKNRGALLGDMLELGPNSVQWHQEVLEKALTVTDKLALCGPDFLAAAKNVELPVGSLLFKDSDHLLQNKTQVLDFFEGKTVLAKSSRDTYIKNVIKEIAERV